MPASKRAVSGMDPATSAAKVRSLALVARRGAACNRLADPPRADASNGAMKMTTSDQVSDHPWSDELQAYLASHPTLAEHERDLDSLSESACRELWLLLKTHEVLEELVREGYLERVR